jgi:2-polyprenyl-3-methyl-5-hydroxy-6-metoxy-1,4-benzoquinol methylase
MTSEHGKKSKFCPYCLSPGRLYVQQGGSDYFRCSGCDLIFRDRRRNESRNTLDRYYEDRYFDDFAADQMTGLRDPVYLRVMDAIERHQPPGTLLDVGCGCGFLLKEARKRGWRIMGIDPSVKSMDHAEKMLDCRLFRGTLEAYPPGYTFDVVTFINVLDHSATPWNDVQRVGMLLKEGGLLFLRFPNGRFHPWILRLLSRLPGDALLRKYPVLHEYSFTPSFIRRLLSDCGFERIDVRNAGLSKGAVPNRFLTMIIAIVVHFLYLISAGTILSGPSLEVTARK